MKHIVMMHNIKKHHDFEHNIHDVLKGLDYEVIYTSSISDSNKYIRSLEEKCRVYVVGGDGTMNGLLQSLVHSEHETVLIPLGTGNDFCRMLCKDRDPVELLKKSLEMDTQKVDTIKVNDRYFLNSACFGVDSIIGNHVHDTENIPFIPESKSYLVSIMKHVFNYQFNEVTLISNDEVLYKGRVTVCAVNNGQYYGGGFRVTPHADIQDGYMNIRIADKIAKPMIPYMITRLVLENLDNHHLVHDFKLKEATLICDNEGNLDGEEYTEGIYHFNIQPESLNMVLYDMERE